VCEIRDHVRNRAKPRYLAGLTPARQCVTARWRALLTGSRFYTGCTQRIPQRSRLRRRLVPASPVTCRAESNNFFRLDRRGQLLLRVVRVDRVRGVRTRVRAVGPARVRRPSDHLGIDPGRYRHSTDGESGDSIEGRRISRVSGARLAVHSAAAKARAPGCLNDRGLLPSRSVPHRPVGVCCGLVAMIKVHVATDEIVPRLSARRSARGRRRRRPRRRASNIASARDQATPL
jgi:hypothetical protein